MDDINLKRKATSTEVAERNVKAKTGSSEEEEAAYEILAYLPAEGKTFKKTARDLFRQAEPERRFQESVVTEMMGKIEEAGLDMTKASGVRQSLNTELRGHLQVKVGQRRFTRSVAATTSGGVLQARTPKLRHLAPQLLHESPE